VAVKSGQRTTDPLVAIIALKVLLNYLETKQVKPIA